ncbi:MAG: hypothetical protein ACI4SS_03585 [Clostridia bacterium]
MEGLEVMTTELVDKENEYVEEAAENSGISTGLAMLIGSGITLAAVAAGSKLKKAWSIHKAKKELSNADDEDAIDAEVVDEENSDKNSKRKK